ncbi:MAG: hypothetical protein KJZ55_02615, partial [Flavobacteriales bacterium]|nr:hypothetical protein [Flavobacteriales bacterium]
MYNILVPVEKKWREPFLRFVALFEIVSIPLLIVLKRVLVKDGNLIYSNYPVRYSCIDLMFVDFLQYKFRFIFFGVKANQMFIMDKIEEMQIQRDQSGRRKSRRNIFIRNEFEMY